MRVPTNFNWPQPSYLLVGFMNLTSRNIRGAPLWSVAERTHAHTTLLNNKLKYPRHWLVVSKQKGQEFWVCDGLETAAVRKEANICGGVQREAAS